MADPNANAPEDASTVGAIAPTESESTTPMTQTVFEKIRSKVVPRFMTEERKNALLAAESSAFYFLEEGSGKLGMGLFFTWLKY